jgi:hypothetical protein
MKLSRQPLYLAARLRESAKRTWIAQEANAGAASITHFPFAWFELNCREMRIARASIS